MTIKVPKMFFCKKYNVSMLAKNADAVCQKRYQQATEHFESEYLIKTGESMKAMQFAHCLECTRGKNRGKEIGHENKDTH